MLELAYIRENKEAAVERLSKRMIDGGRLVDEVLSIDENRRKTQVKLDEMQAASNKMAKAIGQCFQSGDKEKAEQLKSETKSMKGEIKQLNEHFQQLSEQLEEALLNIPNAPHQDVPAGNDEADNQEVRKWGNPPKFDQQPLPHWEIAKKTGIIDFESGNKVSGAGFPFYMGKGARLQRGLINFFLDHASNQGYREVQPPILINEDSGYGTGQLPDKEGQMYHVEKDGLYLIPTAEVPLTNMFRGDIVKESDLPLKLTAYTPCFRREAGSYGSHVRGLNRLHQFDKVELVQAVNPQNSYAVLEQMLTYVEGLLQALGLHYRVLRLCGGDLGFASAYTYDLEVYSAAQEKWLEVSSVSNFESFQAKRMMLRFKDKDNKKTLVHTLNGSALALPRIVAAILENYQQADGSVSIPEVLRPYVGFEKI